ncbi:MAG: sensor histidine kinase [Ignavibacteria bacterium]|nr:sensor histidine kinase [Ignavibacteria bacterium]
MEDLSLHILDIVENSVSAGAKNVEIVVSENRPRDLLRIEISDDGKGMNPAAVAHATDPFYTTRTTRKVGLGLALLEEAAKMANGSMDIHSVPGIGTKVIAIFQHSNIDRKPLGDMAATIVMLVAGSPDVEFTYRYEHDGYTFTFQTKEIRAQLRGLEMNSPDTLSFIREYITEHTVSLS